ncbi:MAG: RluA family pseudouridine synthase [Chlamydiae bacterium]|nr:RluA family pseudouridine synthase [Chlamydiota bacterium]
MKVVFCDNHILVLEKPAGLATQPSLDCLDSLEQQSKWWIKTQFNKSGNVFLHAVHRLDRPVSGLVLFARTSKALSRLNESMRQQHFKKIYKARVEGNLPSHEAELKHYLLHGEYKAIVKQEAFEGAKKCSLFYKAISFDHKTTLVEVYLITGRYHQIRAQFAAAGHPILADKKYGSHFDAEHPGIYLHQGVLSFPHPITKEEMTFTSSADWDV